MNNFMEGYVMKRTFLVLAITIASAFALQAQAPDSVDVTVYFKPTDNPTSVFLPGEFNGWGPNASGVISPGAVSLMTKDASTGIWSKTVRLRVGGQVGGCVSGAYEYKINENGTSTGWFPDPMNPRQNTADNNNSILYINNPTIEY